MVFAEKVAIQLNDTHPAIAVPELMRILMDEEDIVFSRALSICREVFSYTNHTLLPEALEKWPQNLITKVLPRHMQIIHMINYHFLHTEVEAQWPGDNNMKRRLSIIEEPERPGGQQMVRMAYLSVVGSHKVNGVAALHSSLVKSTLFPEFNEMWPDKLVNVTNGVTPRRWLDYCNPELATLIDDTIGKGWTKLTGAETCLSWMPLMPMPMILHSRRSLLPLSTITKYVFAAVVKELCNIEISPDCYFRCADQAFCTNTNVSS